MHRRFLDRGRLFLVGPVAVLGLLAAFAGCGGKAVDPTSVVQPEAALLKGLVSNVSGALRDGGARAEGLFTEGAAPTGADLAKYITPVVFSLEGEPEISGDSATLTVKMWKPSENPNAVDEYTEVGQTKWNAVKVDGKWRLKDVPLP
ncbi:MAG: hypothetical protein JXB62_01135 [Pirellulales bacterium]|nr:hypothetical protein [Pirellulales bacterium]